MVNVGEHAPDFTLKDQNQEEISLTNFKGKKVLLAFYPFAFSPVCSEELGCFQDDLTVFTKKGIKVMAISVDSSYTNKAFSDQLEVSYPLLSDFSREVTKAYGVLRDEGFSDRAYFLIDEQGTISYKHIMTTPSEKLDNTELLNNL